MMWVIMGPSGSGKTYFAGKLIEQLSKEKPVIIVDDTDHYAVELNIPTYSKDNLPKNLQNLNAVKPGSRNL
jgi:uridine kinase